MIPLVMLTGAAIAERQGTAPESSPTIVHSLRMDGPGYVRLVTAEVWPDGDANELDSALLGHVSEISSPDGLEVEFEALRGQWLEGVEYDRDCRATARAAYERSRGC